MNSLGAILAIALTAPASFAADPAGFPTAVQALQSLPEMHSFDATDGTHLVYSVFGGGTKGTLGPLAIAEGKGESAFRYLQFAREMQAKGYGPIFVLDHRGQGFSQQVVANAVHVQDFHEYVDDFIKFLDGPVKKTLAESGVAAKPKIVAHSMGGTIVNLALRERPDLADRVAYITPMFRINLGGAMEALDDKPVEYASGAARNLGLGKVTFGGNVDEFRRAVTPVTGNLLRAEQAERVLNVRTPRETVSWINEALQAGDEIRGPEARPTTPSIFFTGSQDKRISAQAVRDYACTTENCMVIELPGGHPLHQERDSVRTKLEDQIDAFFQGRPVAGTAPGCGTLFEGIREH